MNEVYPEKNRTKESLGVLDIQITCDNAMYEFSPNTILPAFLNEELSLLPATDEKSYWESLMFIKTSNVL